MTYGGGGGGLQYLLFELVLGNILKLHKSVFLLGVDRDLVLTI